MAARFPRCVVLAAVIAAGCSGDEEPVHSYDVPKAAEYEAAPEQADYRTIGAMFPADDPTWFFKFSGPAEQVARYEADFDRLLATVRIPPDNPDPHAPLVPPDFQLPAGWKRLGSRIVGRGGVAMRVHETIRFGPEEDPQEITVTRSGGGTLDNVGRWAAQVGRPQPKPEDLPKLTRVFAADGVKGLRVDVAGPKNPAAARGPMMGGG